MAYRQSFAAIVRVSPASELKTRRRATVALGEAPDGLPWLLRVDRNEQFHRLTSAICGAYEVRSMEDLPPELRQVIEERLVSGLSGIHQTPLEPEGPPATVFVTRQPAGKLLGPTLLSRMLESRDEGTIVPAPGELRADTGATTGPLATAGAPAGGGPTTDGLESVEDMVEELRSSRHLAIDLGKGGVWSAPVAPEDRALRRPSEPARPLLFETLRRLDGCMLRYIGGGEIQQAALEDRDAVISISQERVLADIWKGATFAVPRAAILGTIVETARLAGELHKDGRIHGDLSPANVLIAQDGVALIDALDVKSGEAALAATFEWAAPEQILGRVLDPRADVYAIGKMLTKLLDGVAFGEETTCVIPTGGSDFERVALLRTEGVFIDVSRTSYSRSWQAAWCETLSGCVHHDVSRRPENGDALANRLEQLSRDHPLEGDIVIDDTFGMLVTADFDGETRLARLLEDTPWGGAGLYTGPRSIALDY